MTLIIALSHIFWFPKLSSPCVFVIFILSFVNCPSHGYALSWMIVHLVAKSSRWSGPLKNTVEKQCWLWKQKLLISLHHTVPLIETCRSVSFCWYQINCSKWAEWNINTCYHFTKNFGNNQLYFPTKCEHCFALSHSTKYRFTWTC